MSPPSLNPYSAEPSAAPLGRSRAGFWLALVLVLAAGGVGLVCGGTVGFFSGGIWGQMDLYRRQYDEEKSVVEPILAGDAAYRELEIEQKSDGGIWLSGSVPTQEDYDRLAAALQIELGRGRTEEIMRGVDVGPAEKDP